MVSNICFSLSVHYLECMVQFGSVCEDECPSVCPWAVGGVAIGNRTTGLYPKDCHLWSGTGSRLCLWQVDWLPW